MGLNHYEVLGIEKNASIDEIKNAYRKLAHQYHPDKNPNDEIANQKFIEISKAYHVLSNPSSRARYDMYADDSSVYNSFNTEVKPRRRPPPHFYYKYATEKVEFSRKAYIQATIFVIALIVVVFTFPYILLRMTSIKYYDKAVDNYNNGQYYSALQNIDLSIRDFGKKNAEACALAGAILVNKLNNYEYGIKYINKGLNYDPDDSLASEFHYLKGICLMKQGEPNNAMEEFHLVKNFSTSYDSSLFKQGVILAFVLPNLDSAQHIFKKLISRNDQNFEASYYHALILQKKGEHKKAIVEFNYLLKKNIHPAAIYYHIARSEIQLDQIDDACIHLRIANSYNLKEAEQLINLYCSNGTGESIFLDPYN